MAKEYIEREAAKNAIYEYICGHTMSKFPSRELFDASKKGAEGAMYELDYVPAADVVEVVRCKDCKWWQMHEGMIEANVCCATFDYHGKERITVPTDFCSYGERKDGNEKNIR